MNPGSPQYILHVHDNRQNKLVKDVTVNGKQTNEVCVNSQEDVQTIVLPSSCQWRSKVPISYSMHGYTCITWSLMFFLKHFWTWKIKHYWFPFVQQLLKLKDDLTCPICLSLFHDVVTIAPCLHNFWWVLYDLVYGVFLCCIILCLNSFLMCLSICSNGCFSRWYKNKRMFRCDCPQCREAVVFVKRNHTLHNIIQVLSSGKFVVSILSFYNFVYIISNL